MQGFMRQRGGSWELRVYVGRDPVTSAKRYATETVRAGKREAQTALAAIGRRTDQPPLPGLGDQAFVVMVATTP